MAKAKREWHGHCEFPLTEEYERGHEATFGKEVDRHCPKCGRLPTWCECAKTVTIGETCGINADGTTDLSQFDIGDGR